MVVKKCKYESYNTPRLNTQQHFFVNAGEIRYVAVVKNMLLEGAT